MIHVIVGRPIDCVVSPGGFRGRGIWDVVGKEEEWIWYGEVQVLCWGRKGNSASLLNFLRKMPVDLAFAVDFQSCVRYCPESDSEDENVFEPKEVKKTVKPSLKKIDFVKARNTTIENENKAEKKFSQSPRAKTNNFNEKVNTTKVDNVTTAGPKAVVSAVEGNRNNAVKSLACWIWRPKGNLIDHISKDSGSYTLKRFNYVDPHGRLKSAKVSAARRKLVLLGVSTAGFSLLLLVTVKDNTAEGDKCKYNVDGKTMVIIESAVRHLHFNNEDGITCLSNDEIFENLALMGQINLAEPFNDVYVTPVHTKKVFTNMKRQNKDFLGIITPLFASMLVPQVVEGEGEDDKVVRAAITTTSLEVEQASGNIYKTQSMETLNEPSPQRTSSGSGPRRKSLDKDNVSKQGRNLKTRIKEGDSDDDFDDTDDMLDNAMENIEGDTVNDAIGVSAASASVTTVGVSISTAKPRIPPTTTTKMDEELALRLHEEEKAELERMHRDRPAQEEASNTDLTAEFDDVQARIDADVLFATRL
nr:hypothetical protein [Tanacetum cinerariifolium]